MPVKPTASQQLEAVNNNVLVLIGRLLESAEAAQSGLRALNDEVRENSGNVQMLQSSIAIVVRTVQELDQIVRTGANGAEALSTKVRMLADESNRLQMSIRAVETALTGHSERIDDIERSKLESSGGHQMGVKITVIIAWIITTGVAIYAAIGQWVSGGSK